MGLGWFKRIAGSADRTAAEYMEIYRELGVLVNNLRDLSTEAGIAYNSGNDTALTAIEPRARSVADLLVTTFRNYEERVPAGIRASVRKSTRENMLKVADADELKAKIHAEYFPFNKS